MSHRLTRAGLWFAALTALSCASSKAYVWRLSDFAPLPVDGLAGAPVGILPLAVLEADTGVVGAPLGPAGRAAADSVIAQVLNRRAKTVPWITTVALRDRARDDKSMPNPDSLPIHLLQQRALTGVPEPLLTQMRALMPQGRHMLYPAHLTYRVGRAQKVRAEFTVYVVDIRVGALGWKSDVLGEGKDPLDALTTALRTLTATGQ